MSEHGAGATDRSSEGTQSPSVAAASDRRDAETQATPENRTQAHQSQVKLQTGEEERQTVDINVPSLQLSGSAVNQPLDLSQAQESSMLRRSVNKHR